MAWNEPNGGRDPWNQGGRRGNGGGSPPDVDELLNRLRSRFGKGGGGGSGGPARIGGGSLGLIIALIAALWLASGFYVVDEQERGVVLRFGQYTTTTDPGLRWHLPWPVFADQTLKRIPQSFYRNNFVAHWCLLPESSGVSTASQLKHLLAFLALHSYTLSFLP